MLINVSDDDLTDSQKRIIHELADCFQTENAEIEMLSEEINILYEQAEELREREMEDDHD